MAGTTLPYITAPYPAADMIALDNMIISSLNANLTAFTLANPTVGISNVGNTAGTTSVQGANQIVFAGGNNITLSQSVDSSNKSATITISANNESPIGISNLGNTAGTSGAVSGQLVFVGTNNINLSQSVNGVSGTLSIDLLPAKRLFYPDDALTAISVPVNSSESIRYLPIKYNLSATRIDVYASISADTGADLSTRAFGLSQWFGIYTNNAGTLSSLSTGSTVQTLSYTSNGTTSVNGLRLLSAPFTVNATPGDYYLLYNIATLGSNSSGGGTTATSAMTMTMYGGGQIGSNNAFVDLGAASATSIGALSGMGIYTATSSNVPATINLTGLGVTGTQAVRADIGVQFRGV